MFDISRVGFIVRYRTQQAGWCRRVQDRKVSLTVLNGRISCILEAKITAAAAAKLIMDLSAGLNGKPSGGRSEVSSWWGGRKEGKTERFSNVDDSFHYDRWYLDGFTYLRRL